MSSPCDRIPKWAWPLSAEPVVVLADRFALRGRAFETEYLTPNHALHLHDYVGRFRLGDDVFDLEPGVVTLTPGQVSSAYDLPEPGTHWCMHFEPASQTIASSQANLELPCVMQLGSRRAEAESRFAHLSQMQRATQWAGTDTARELAVAAARAAARDLLLWLAAAAQPQRLAGQHEHPAIPLVLGFIDQQLDQPIVVPELAKRVGLRQDVLSRAFKQAMQCTLPQYILRRRIDTASLLLSTTQLPVQAVGARVGLPDPHHFNKQFRRLTGKSPSAARNVGG